MATPYYVHTTYPATGSTGSSLLMREELRAISESFDLLPTPTGNAYKLLSVNGAGTALTTSGVYTDANGALGVGAAPGANGLLYVLHNSASVPALYVQQSGAGNVAHFVSPGGQLTVTGGGRVGINTATPLYSLTIQGNGAWGSTLGAALHLFNNVTSRAAVIAHDDSQNLQIHNADASGTGAIIFRTGTGTGTIRVSIKSTGQLRLHPLASDPAGGEAGDVYFNSSTNKFRGHNGTSFVDLH